MKPILNLMDFYNKELNATFGKIKNPNINKDSYMKMDKQNPDLSIADALNIGNYNAVEILLKNNYKVEKDSLINLFTQRNVDSYSFAPLDLIEKLIQRGADVNAIWIDEDKYSKNEVPILHLAIKLNLIDIIKLFIKYKVDINKADSYGMTPLMVACQNGYLDIVKLLLNSNANIDAQNKYGATVLIIAILKQNIDMMKLLLKYKPDVLLYTDENKTVFSYASKLKDKNIINLLNQYSENL